MFILTLSRMGMAVLLLGGEVIDSKMGACLLRLVKEVFICQRSSKGEDWYGINPTTRIFK